MEGEWERKLNFCHPNSAPLEAHSALSFLATKSVQTAKAFRSASRKQGRRSCVIIDKLLEVELVDFAVFFVQIIEN